MVMAIASGNPDLLTKVNIEEEVRGLEAANTRAANFGSGTRPPPCVERSSKRLTT
jgi:hypothetical protein